MPGLALKFPNAKSPDTLDCPYRTEPAGLAQARFSGRDILRPDIDLSRYRVRAVYDWIDLVVRLGANSQFRHIQDELLPFAARKLHVTPLGAHESGTTDQFRIRIQDPSRKLLNAIVTALDRRWGMRGAPTVDEIEVSIDFYPHSGDDEERQILVGILQRHFLPRDEVIFSDKQCRKGRERSRRHLALIEQLEPRQAWGRGSAKTDILRPGNAENIALDATYYLCAKDWIQRWRVMDKVSNNRNGEIAVSLPQEAKRARVEVTLDSLVLQGLGITTLASLYRFKAERLASKLFSFWLPTAPIGIEKPSETVDVARNEIRSRYIRRLNQMGVLGCLNLDYVRASVPRISATGSTGASVRLGPMGYLAAWVELNDMVRRSLLQLRL